MKVKQIDVDSDMKVSDLVDQFDKSGGLGAGRVGKACNILVDMIQDEDTNVFLSLGGPFIPGGMRNVVTKMINNGHVGLIVSSGANITHDLVEAFGGAHYQHEGRDDEDLNADGIGRIADINVGSDDFTIFEREITKIFEGNNLSAFSQKMKMDFLGSTCSKTGLLFRQCHPMKAVIKNKQ